MQHEVVLVAVAVALVALDTMQVPEHQAKEETVD